MHKKIRNILHYHVIPHITNNDTNKLLKFLTKYNYTGTKLVSEKRRMLYRHV